MNKFKFLLGPMRLPFLILTPACALLGLGTAVWTTGPVNGWHFVLALLGAVCAHISVNAFNEYFDFKSGLDAKTQRTPFSGGSGTLPAQAEMARPTLAMAWITLGITALSGLYFVILRGPSILPLGLIGLLLLYAYTPWITRNPLLCLIAPGLGFGPLMVMSVHFALTGAYSWTAFIASLVPFFLVSNLLLLNQFPDVEPDRSIGRRHIVVLFGLRTASLVYNLFLLLAYLTIVLGVVFGLLPAISLIGLLTAVIAIPAGWRAFRHAEDIPQLIPAMGMNVLINLLTPTLIGIGLLIR
ncbi:MAG TPA: prenyltransferase [Anaerolineales bacterium]|nr:prenyltransferase [Anaerolineales bacterium]